MIITSNKGIAMKKDETALFEHKLTEFLRAANACPGGIGDGIFSLATTLRRYPDMVANQIKGKRDMFLARRGEDIDSHLEAGRYDKVRELRANETEALINFQVAADEWSELYSLVGRNYITFIDLYRTYGVQSDV